MEHLFLNEQQETILKLQKAYPQSGICNIGGIVKLGLKREKVGDIFVFKDGADILVLDEAHHCFTDKRIEILETLKHNISSYHKLYDGYRVLHYNTILFRFCQ